MVEAAQTGALVAVVVVVTTLELLAVLLLLRPLCAASCAVLPLKGHPLMTILGDEIVHENLFVRHHHCCALLFWGAALRVRFLFGG